MLTATPSNARSAVGPQEVSVDQLLVEPGPGMVKQLCEPTNESTVLRITNGPSTCGPPPGESANVELLMLTEPPPLERIVGAV